MTAPVKVIYGGGGVSHVLRVKAGPAPAPTPTPVAAPAEIPIPMEESVRGVRAAMMTGEAAADAAG